MDIDDEPEKRVINHMVRFDVPWVEGKPLCISYLPKYKAYLKTHNLVDVSIVKRLTL